MTVNDNNLPQDLKERDNASPTLEFKVKEIKQLMMEMQSHSHEQSKQRQWMYGIMAGGLAILAVLNISIALKPVPLALVETNSKGELVDHATGNLVATKPEGSHITIKVNKSYIGRRLMEHVFGGKRRLKLPDAARPGGGGGIRDPHRRPIFHEQPAGFGKRRELKQMKDDYLNGVDITVTYDYEGVTHSGRPASGGRFTEDEDGCQIGYNLKEEGTDGPYFEVQCCDEDEDSDCVVYEAADEVSDRRYLVERNYYNGCNRDGQCQNRELASVLPICNKDYPVDDKDGSCGCQSDSDCGDGNFCDTNGTYAAGVCIRSCSTNDDCRADGDRSVITQLVKNAFLGIRLAIILSS